MSAVDDFRKIIQDLVAPDLKAIEATMKENFASIEKLSTVRHELILAELKTFQAISDARYESIMRALDVDRRLERREALQPHRPS